MTDAEQEVADEAQLNESGGKAEESEVDAWTRISQLRGGVEELDQDESEEGEQGEAESEESEEPQEETVSEETDEKADRTGETEDLWSKAPEELRKAYQQTAQNRDRLGGTVSGLQKKINALEAQLAENAKKQKELVKSNPESFDPNDPYKEMREYYPEVAAPVESLMNQLQEKNRLLEEQFKIFAEEKQEREIAAQYLAVKEEVPDIDEIASSEDFKNWAYSQPEAVRQIIQRNGERIVDAQEASFVLKAYKMQTGKGNNAHPAKPRQSSKRAKQIAAASLPGSRVTGQVVGSDTVSANATDEERWAAMARRRARMRNQ